MAGIKAVARAAGVSVATASRALNGRPEVSPATRAKVLAAAEELGYSPDPTARALVGGVEGGVWLVADERTAAVAGRLAAGMAPLLRRFGRSLRLDVGGEMARKAEGGVDAGELVVLESPVDDTVGSRRTLPGWSCVVGRVAPGGAGVRLDAETAGWRCAAQLVERAGRQAWLAPTGVCGWFWEQFVDGFVGAWEAAGRARPRPWSGERATRAAQAGDVLLAEGCGEALRRALEGRKGEGVAVLAVEWEDARALEGTGVSAVDVPWETVGQEAAELVVRASGAGGPSAHRTVVPGVALRGALR